MNKGKRYEIRISDIINNNSINDDTDFIPLISEEDDDSLKKVNIPQTIPILPLRNSVLFPGVLIPITVGRQKSMKLIKEAYNTNKIIGTIAQKDSNIEEPK